MRLSGYFALGASLLAAGFGGGTASASSPLQSTPPQLKTTAATGITQLNAALKAAFTAGTATPAQFATADATFHSAFTAKPTDPRAAAGYAITEVLMRTADAYQAIAGTALPLAAANTDGLQGALAGPQMFTTGAYHFTDAGLATISELTHLQPATTTSSQWRQLILADAAKVQSEIAPLKALLTGPLTNTLINGLEASPIVLTNPQTGKNFAVGKAEMYALRGSLEGIIASLEMLTAYSYDIGATFNIDANPNIILKTQITGGAVFSSSLLLPGNPFLTRTTNPGADPANLLLAGVGDTVAMVNALKVRTNVTFLLNPVTVPPLSQAGVIADAAMVKSYLTTPQTLKFNYAGQTVSLTVNAGGFIRNLPSDLKALLPNVKGVADPNLPGSHEIFITNFPDLTFGNLVTNGATALANLKNQPILDRGRPVDFEQAASYGDLYSLLYNVSQGKTPYIYPGEKLMRVFTDWSPGEYGIQFYVFQAGNTYYGPWVERGTAPSSSTDIDVTGSGLAVLYGELYVKASNGTQVFVGTINKFINLGVNQSLKLAAGLTLKPTKLILGPSGASIPLGSSVTFCATGQDALGRFTFAPSGVLKWSTTGGVASVSGGLVTGTKKGPGTVVATYTSPALSQTAAITVH